MGRIRQQGGMIYRRGPRWYFGVKLDGVWVRRSSGSANRSQAQRLQLQAEERVRLGLPLDHKESGQTLKDFLHEYLSYLDKNGVDTDREGSAFAHVVERFPTKSLVALTRQDLDAYVTWRLGSERKPRPATVQREIVVLRGALRRAQRWQRIRENPAVDTRVEGADHGRGRQLTDGEIADLIRAARKLHPEMADLIEVAAQTACRLGELLRLRERDCDFTNDEVCAWGGKGKRPRRVPMHQRAWQILRVRCTDRAPDRRLFAIANTNRPFAQIARAAGVANVRFHDLRAAASAFLLESGADLFTVKAITGFAAGTLLKLSTVSAEQKRAAVRRLPTFRDAKGER